MPFLIGRKVRGSKVFMPDIRCVCRSTFTSIQVEILYTPGTSKLKTFNVLGKFSIIQTINEFQSDSKYLCCSENFNFAK